MTRIKKAEFVKSAAEEKGLLKGRPQIVFAGKSNSGKSSLINMVTNNNKLARVGQTPGLTVFVNFFKCVIENEASKDFYLVDLPGYGYAQSGKAKTKDFSSLVESYLTENDEIKQLFLLIDIRHGANENDQALINFLNYHQVPFTVVATKADKLSRAQAFTHRDKLANQLGLGKQNVMITSSAAKTGKEELLNLIYNKL